MCLNTRSNRKYQSAATSNIILQRLGGAI